jgi:cysteine synthase
MSSGGSVATAVKLAEEMESGVIVAIICDEEIVIYHLIYLTK